MRVVRVAGSTLEASILARRLEAAGIRVWTNGDEGPGHPAVSILVQDEDADRASQILESLDDTPPPEVLRSRSSVRQALGSLAWALYVTPPAIVLMLMVPWEPARPIGVCVLAALAIGALGFSLKKLMGPTTPADP